MLALSAARRAPAKVPRAVVFSRNFSAFLDKYSAHVKERADMGIVPKPLDAPTVAELVKLLEKPPKGEEAQLKQLIQVNFSWGAHTARKH